MAIAVTMARRGLGTTAPNPSVGAVLVDPARDVVVARGWTAPGGRPHAERIAIDRAGDVARGATLYVTLEPCAHHGKTPPCADAVIAAGIGRVVAGIEDPDPRVASRGLARIAAAGIAVERFVLAEACHWVTYGHILRVTERRPFVQLKLALDADGRVPRGGDGAPVWVTGPLSRAAGHVLRAEADAILVGRGTVADDDPDLTCRLPGAAWRSPLRVVLAHNLDLPLAARLFSTTRDVPVLVFASSDADGACARVLLDLGAQIEFVRSIDGRLWLPAVLEALVARGITRLLVEGGPSVWQAFDRAGLVDEAVLFAAGGGRAAADPVAALADHLPRFQGTITDRRVLGPDIMVTFARRPSRPGSSAERSGGGTE